MEPDRPRGGLHLPPSDLVDRARCLSDRHGFPDDEARADHVRHDIVILFAEDVVDFRGDPGHIGGDLGCGLLARNLSHDPR